METSQEFLKGGNLRDIALHSEWSLRPGLLLTSMLQYEWWNFPLLTQGKKQSNFTASFQLTYSPHWKFKGKEETDRTTAAASVRPVRTEPPVSVPRPVTPAPKRPGDTP